MKTANGNLNDMLIKWLGVTTIWQFSIFSIFILCITSVKHCKAFKVCFTTILTFLDQGYHEVRSFFMKDQWDKTQMCWIGMNSRKAQMFHVVPKNIRQRSTLQILLFCKCYVDWIIWYLRQHCMSQIGKAFQRDYIIVMICDESKLHVRWVWNKP